MMKSASMKAFFFMVALVLVIIGLVVAMVSLSDVDLSAALQKIKTIVGVVYPRIRDDYRSE